MCKLIGEVLSAQVPLVGSYDDGDCDDGTQLPPLVHDIDGYVTL